MSYDLFAFDVGRAPAEDASLLGWFTQQAQWDERRQPLVGAGGSGEGVAVLSRCAAKKL